MQQKYNRRFFKKGALSVIDNVELLMQNHFVNSDVFLRIELLSFYSHWIDFGKSFQPFASLWNLAFSSLAKKTGCTTTINEVLINRKNRHNLSIRLLGIWPEWRWHHIIHFFKILHFKSAWSCVKFNWDVSHTIFAFLFWGARFWMRNADYGQWKTSSLFSPSYTSKRKNYY